MPLLPIPSTFVPMFGKVAAVSALDDLFADEPRMLSVGRVAEVLGMSPKGVYKWIDDGSLPAYKVSGRWFIVRDELISTLEQGSNKP